MKNTLLIISIFWTLPICLISQDLTEWTYDFGVKIEWSYFEAKTSIYYLHDGENFIAFDCLTKEIMWSIDAKGLEIENITRSDEMPIAWLNSMNSSKKRLTSKRNVLIDKISGQILFDSDLFEMDVIKGLRVLYDQELVFAEGKHDKTRVLALAEFGKEDWSWIVENPIELKSISTRSRLKSYPSANKDHLFIHYEDNVFTISRESGMVNWQANVGDINFSNYFTRRNFLRTNDPNFYLATKNASGDFEIMAHDYATGNPQWNKPLDAGSFYSISGRENDFFIRTKNYFGFIDYEKGEGEITGKSIFEDRLGKVYLQKDGYLVTLFPSEKTLEEPVNSPYFKIDLLSKDYKTKWSTKPVLNGKEIIRIEKSGNLLIILTDVEIALVKLDSGAILNRVMTCKSPLFALNPSIEKAIFFDTTTSILQSINLNNGDMQVIERDLEFEHKKDEVDAPFSLISIGDNFALIGERNLWLINSNSNILYKKYFERKTSFNWKKALLVTGGIIGGVVFGDELRQINYELYNEGLIDPNEYWNNTWAMGVYQKVGTGAVGGQYVSRLMPAEEKTSVSKFFNDTWIITDKLDKGKFGIRLIDILSGKELKSIWLSKNDIFSFEIDFRQKGLYTVDKSNLNFYKL